MQKESSREKLHSNLVTSHNVSIGLCSQVAFQQRGENQRPSLPPSSMSFSSEEDREESIPFVSYKYIIVPILER